MISDNDNMAAALLHDKWPGCSSIPATELEDPLMHILSTSCTSHCTVPSGHGGLITGQCL